MISKRLHPASFSNVNSQLASKANVAQEAWIALTLQNSWVNFGGATETAAYFKDTLGNVRLKGLIKSGTLQTTVFELPLNYRPAQALWYPVAVNGGVGTVSISSTGLVKVDTGNNTYVSLAGISFRT